MMNLIINFRIKMNIKNYHQTKNKKIKHLLIFSICNINKLIEFMLKKMIIHILK